MSIAFFQVSLDDEYRARSREMAGHISSLPDAAFSHSDRDQKCKAIADKFSFTDLPEIVVEQIERDEAQFVQGRDDMYVRVLFPCTGNAGLFKLYQRSRPGYPPPPQMDFANGILSKTYQLERQNADRLDELVQADLAMINQYFGIVRQSVPAFNEQMLADAKHHFDRRLHDVSQKNTAAAKLSQSKLTLRKRDDAPSKIIVPVQRKPIAVETPKKVDAASEYELGLAEYDDILSTITSMVKVMERSPAVFSQMKEEALRTILLVALNGIYEGQATGETFNGSGDTDILIRREDRNVFIAECLMWKGPKYLTSKMDDQLFHYAVWRDSKLALVVFNRGGNFSSVIQTMRETVKSHKQCVGELNWLHESGARFRFRRHDDPSREFVLTAIAFDVPSPEK